MPLDFSGIRYDVTGTLSEFGLESALFAIAQNLPLTGVLSVVLLFLTATFLLASANSATLALSMFVSGKENHSRGMRAFWGMPWGLWRLSWPGQGAW